MRKFFASLGSALGTGLLVVAPVYLGVLLLLKIMQSLAGLVKPLVGLLPDWLPAERLLSLLLVLLVCLMVGLVVRTRAGQAMLEHSVLQKLPGYTLFRSLTQRIAGHADSVAWKPALAEIEEALVPAFIIEEHADGRYTVFVPSVPTPLAGAVYVVTCDRVHPVDVAFTQALKTVTRWGGGCKDLVAAMEGAIAARVPCVVCSTAAPAALISGAGGGGGIGGGVPLRPARPPADAASSAFTVRDTSSCASTTGGQSSCVGPRTLVTRILNRPGVSGGSIW